MTFDPANVKQQLMKIIINTLELPMATHFKFLSVWVDDKLTWRYHVNQLILK